MSELNTHKIKRIANLIVSEYPDKFSSDFEANKKSLDGLLAFPSKNMRNKAAGYITRIAKRAEGEPAEAELGAVAETEELQQEQGLAQETQPINQKTEETSAKEVAAENKPKKTRKTKKKDSEKTEENAGKSVSNESNNNMQPTNQNAETQSVSNESNNNDAKKDDNTPG